MSEPARMDVDERERIRHRLRLLRGALDALDIALDQDGVPLGTDIAQNSGNNRSREAASG